MESYESLVPEYIPNCYTYGTVNYMNQDDVSLLLCPSEIDELTSEGNESSLQQITKEDLLINTPDSTLYDTTDSEFSGARCPVCGIGDVGRHYHYGGRACSSCRAFFRRAVQNNSFKKFKCRNLITLVNPIELSNSSVTMIENIGGNNFHNESRISSSNGMHETSNASVNHSVSNYCKIDSRSWKSCRYCRFQRCLSCGLRPSWVLTKQQRSFRQQKRVKPRPSFTYSTKKDNKILKTLLDQQRSVLKCEEILPLTEEEVNSLLHRIQNITTMGTEIFLRYFTNKPETFVEMIRAGQTKQVLPYKLVKEFRSAVMDTGKKMALNVLLEIAHELPVSDCLMLIESNLPFITTLFTAAWTTNKRRPESTMKKITAVISKLLQGPENDEERHQSIILKNIFTELNVPFEHGQFNVCKYQYRQLFCSPWSSDIAIEERHLELIRKIASWLVLKDDGCKDNNREDKADQTDAGDRIELVDENKLFLMGIILLFSTFDISSGLEQLDGIEAIQEDMVTLLHRYLIYRYGVDESAGELAKSMDLISMTREALEIQRRHRLPV